MDHESEQTSRSAARVQRYVAAAMMALALTYAVLAGLRTVLDFDLGWQLATGRYIVQHLQIPRTDVLSYTALGKEWIYPPFSGVLLYLVYLLGGYPALSWLSAITCCATVAVLLRRGSAATAALAALAVPIITYATAPRAELFTTVLFAAFVAILWRQFRGERSRWSGTWLLPVLMLLWVNLHLGFIAGLAMIGAYGVVELFEMPFASRRRAPLARLRRAGPWLLATVLMTVVNPWGPRIYLAIVRQQRMLENLGGLVNWWLKPYVSFASLREALNWHNPDSGYWWLVGVASVVVILALWQRRFGVAVVLGTATYLSLSRVRYQAPFACLAVAVAGSVLSDLELPGWGERLRDLLDRRLGTRSLGCAGMARLLMVGGVLLLVVVRSAGLMWNRTYLSTGQLSLFGPGLSWWYPERATAFLLREHLPGNIFNDYNVGGYLTWRIGPDYPVYVDGRGIPFEPDFLSHYSSLMQQPPDSPAWQREADLRNINTILVSVARYGGLGSFPLQDFCGSPAWRLVYLDEVAAIFVRNRPENVPWLRRLQLDCATAPLAPPSALFTGSQTRQVGELYNFYANAGALLYVLGRSPESLRDLRMAETIFPDDSNLHLTKGQLLQANHHPELAELEYQDALRLRQSDMGWYLLGHLYISQRRYGNAAVAIVHAAMFSYQAYDRYLELGELYNYLGRSQDALEAFDRAGRLSPYVSRSPSGAPFYARQAAGRARAWQALGNLDRAIEFQKHAVALTPNDPGRWARLAEMYKSRGRLDLAQEADKHALGLSSR